jgi:predicted nucleic acid-binding protein
MPAKVIDASALGALLFGEAQGGQIAGQLRGNSLFAPAILPFEIASICLKKIRRSPLQRENLFSAFAVYENAEIEIVDIDRTEVLASAESFGLTVYDASYLCLAAKLGAGLVTLDKKLDAAAKALPGR